MLPNFLIIGASKCGTTALYYYLKQHKDISFPTLKEPKYFSSIFQKFPHKGIGDESVDLYAIKTLKEYKKLFKKISNIRVGEASPDTMYFYKNTIPRIKETLGDIPIIIMLRNPVERAFSAYMYLRRDSREKLSFREALEIEEHRLENNWDFIWAYKKAGLYHNQIKPFLENFSNVKIVLQEDLRSETYKTLNGIFSFLSVDNSFKPNISINHNPSGIPNNIIAKFLLSRENKISTRIREIAKFIMPRNLLEKLANESLVKQNIPKQEQENLKSYFYNDICKTEELIKQDLTLWK